MKYVDSITDFFTSPKWGTNLLLGAATMMIPVIGPLVLSGWHVTLLWARGDDEDPANYPPFDFQYFGKYLERGLWPFLVSMAASVVLVPIVIFLIFGPLLIFGLLDSHGGNERHEMIPIALLVSMFCVYPIILIAFQLLLVPLILRATIMQDFARAFDVTFVKSFLSLVWKELLLSTLFMFGVSMCLMIVTIITCYIGGILLGPVFIFGWHHLQKQLYQLYVCRGGQPAPHSPKLRDLPPPLHQA